MLIPFFYLFYSPDEIVSFVKFSFDFLAPKVDIHHMQTSEKKDLMIIN